MSTDSYSDQEMLDEIRRVAEIVDGSPRTVDINEHAMFHSSTVSRRFGSHSEALKKADLELNYKPSKEYECDNCGESYMRAPSHTTGEEHTFCSKDCHYEFLNKTDVRAGENHPCWNGGDVTVQCSYCGSELERTQHRTERCDEFFCDDECKGQWQSENLTGEDSPIYSSIDVPCSNCGDTISKTPSTLQNNEHAFCDKQCHDDWQRENYPTGEEHHGYTCVETSCEQCDSLLELKPHEVQRSKRNFCDTSCYLDWMSDAGEEHPNWKGKAERDCANCGVTVKRRPSIAEMTERSFCSAECNREWKRENWVGENSPGWKGGWERYYGPNWNTQRRKARKNDDYTCQGCGLTQEEHLDQWKERLHVHHIVPFRDHESYEEANRVDNLVTLCRNCHHGKWEGIPLKPQLVPSAD